MGRIETEYILATNGKRPHQHPDLQSRRQFCTTELRTGAVREPTNTKPESVVRIYDCENIVFLHTLGPYDAVLRKLGPVVRNIYPNVTGRCRAHMRTIGGNTAPTLLGSAIIPQTLMFPESRVDRRTNKWQPLGARVAGWGSRSQREPRRSQPGRSLKTSVTPLREYL